MKYSLLFILPALIFLLGSARPMVHHLNNPGVNFWEDSLAAGQLMVVVTEGWDSMPGKIYCFDLTEGEMAF